MQFIRKFEEDMKTMTLSQFEVYLKSLFSIIHIEVQLYMNGVHIVNDGIHIRRYHVSIIIW